MAKFKLEDGTEIEAFTADEVQAKIDESTGGLKSKVDELLGETKTAKQKAQELEELQAKAEEDRLKEKQEFKTLFEQRNSELIAEREATAEYKAKVQGKDIEIQLSNDIAQFATKDASRAKALKRMAMENAKHDGEKVYYELGGVAVDAETMLNSYKEEFGFMFDGTQSSGGRAEGGNGGAEHKKPSEMNSAERIAFKERDPNGFKQAFNL